MESIETARKRIEQKRALAARIQELKDALPSASEHRTTLKQESEAAWQAVDAYLGKIGRPRDESQLEEAERAYLAELRQKAEAASQAHRDAAAQYEAMHEEIRQLQHELLDFRVGADVDALLAHQQAIDEADAEAARLQGLIAKQEAAIQAGGSHEPELATLRQQREDLLAEEIAGGAAKTEEIEELDARVVEIERQASESRQTATQAGQTINGLKRKHAEAQRKLSEVKSPGPELVDSFLLGEAETLGAEYAVVARELGALFVRLVALDEIINAARGDHSRQVLRRSSWDGFFVPNFNLKAHANPDKYGDQATLIAANKLAYSDVYRDAQKTELERLRGLGVNLI